ncbi:MAG: hypothetical protein KJ985_02065, partial [Proteobacteria bacterium]|nr:hypothetical protein [Pseudomonadota bacterium]
HTPKLFTSEPTIRYQPSTSTKSNSLKGRETITGGSIIMPMASILLSMGMMMLPPVMVSLPFKLLLFVLVDGWYLIVGSLVKSFGV